MPRLELGDEDARFAALAVAYHLGRPGSETDPDTLQHHERGLGPVGDALGPQLGQARVVLDVTPYQLHRLDEALLGVVNELKAYEMAQRHSAVPGFEAAATLLFPALTPKIGTSGESDLDRPGGDLEGDDEAESALDLVERVVFLQRRLGGAVAEAKVAMEAERVATAEAAAAARRQRRRWWQVWIR